MLARIFPKNVISNPNGPFTEHDPVIFHERAEDLRAYCWRLYVQCVMLFLDLLMSTDSTTSFEEMAKQSDPSAVDFSRLLSIYYLANKYQMLRDEAWARNCVVTHCEQTQDADRLFSRCTEFELERLLVMACDAGIESLKQAIGSVWARMLQKNPARSINNVLNLAERLNLRRFQGQLYYAALVRVTSKSNEEDMDSQIAKLGIQPIQLVHLMKGYQALTEFCWITSALPINKKIGRIHRSCEQEWKRLWTPEIQREGGFDPVGTLLAYTGGVQSCVKSPCNIRIHAQATFDSLLDTMEDKFL